MCHCWGQWEVKGRSWPPGSERGGPGEKASSPFLEQRDSGEPCPSKEGGGGNSVFQAGVREKLAKEEVSGLGVGATEGMEKAVEGPVKGEERASS